MARPNSKRYISLNAPVILSFVFLCLVALVLDKLTNGTTTRNWFMVYHCPLNSVGAYVRFFGHVLGHSGWAHFFNNTLYILLLGPAIEEKYGSGITILTIALTALVTGLIQFFLFPGTALLGASGVVFMLIVFSSFTSFRKNEIPVTAILVFLLYVGQEVYNAVAVTDGISQMAHIAGGVLGVIFGLTFRSENRVRG
ncbi:MAG: rhomboid family intramembrane serine protease [Firmicutes bacterium]|nr:rhomboid family intramembrane serine protease [Bacillota bacterium]